MTDKFSLDLAIAVLGKVDDTKALMKIHVTTLDRDKDGFIDESEFKCIVAMLLIHDPSFPTVNYKTFVEEADTNKDGKVSIDEAVEWFSKNANN